MLNICWTYKHMQRALGTVLRLSIKDNNRSGDCCKWTLTLHHPGPTVARVWMCTALVAGHANALHVGLAPFSSAVFHCICLYLFMFWWASISLGHGCWAATQHPKPRQKEFQELWVSLEHGAVFLRDRVLSGHWNPDEKWQCQQALGVSAEDLWCTKVLM